MKSLRESPHSSAFAPPDRDVSNEGEHAPGQIRGPDALMTGSATSMDKKATQNPHTEPERDGTAPVSYSVRGSGGSDGTERASSAWKGAWGKEDGEEKPTMAHIQHVDSICSATSGETRSFRENILSLYKVWYWELLSAALSIASFMAIVAVLATQDGRPVPNWPSPITVNSLIASFTVIFKAALIMPIAEGAWGSRSERPLGNCSRSDFHCRSKPVEMVAARARAPQLGRNGRP
jgi:hypothetical protein